MGQLAVDIEHLLPVDGETGPRDLVELHFLRRDYLSQFILQKSMVPCNTVLVDKKILRQLLVGCLQVRALACDQALPRLEGQPLGDARREGLRDGQSLGCAEESIRSTGRAGGPDETLLVLVIVQHVAMLAVVIVARSAFLQGLVIVEELHHGSAHVHFIF